MSNIQVNLIKLADYFDSIDRFKDADIIDQVLQKIAEVKDVQSPYLAEVEKLWQRYEKGELELNEVIDEFRRITLLKSRLDSEKYIEEKDIEEEPINVGKEIETLEISAELADTLVKIADQLDAKNAFEEADEIDRILAKLAKRVGLYRLYQVSEKLQKKDKKLAKQLKNIIIAAVKIWEELPEAEEPQDVLEREINNFLFRSASKLRNVKNADEVDMLLEKEVFDRIRNKGITVDVELKQQARQYLLNMNKRAKILPDNVADELEKSPLY